VVRLRVYVFQCRMCASFLSMCIHNYFINKYESKQPRSSKLFNFKDFYRQRANSLKIDHDGLLAHLSVELLQLFFYCVSFLFIYFYFLFGYLITLP
jgi:hypothetical protein